MYQVSESTTSQKRQGKQHGSRLVEAIAYTAAGDGNDFEYTGAMADLSIRKKHRYNASVAGSRWLDGPVRERPAADASTKGGQATLARTRT